LLCILSSLHGHSCQSPSLFSDGQRVVVPSNMTVNGVDVSNSISSLQQQVASLQSQVAALSTGVYFRASKATSQTISAGVWTKLTWDTLNIDSCNGFSALNNRYTPNVAGKYAVFATLAQPAQFTSLGAAWDIAIYIDGGQSSYSSTAGWRASYPNFNAQIFDIVSLNGVSDYIEIWFFQGDSTSDTTAAEIPGSIYWTAYLIH